MLILSPETREIVLSKLRPTAAYQIRYASGYQRASGSDLRGNARKHSLGYRDSRRTVESIARTVAESRGNRIERTTEAHGLVVLREVAT